TAATAQVHARVDGEPIWVLALPPTSIGGLNVMIRAHDTGIRPIAVRSIGGAEPFTDDAFATAVRDATATGRPIAVSLVPSQVTRLLATSVGQETLRQCSLTLVGGGPVDPQLTSRCRDAGITLTTTYGMTETSGGCVFDGRPLDGVEVRIDDADSRVCISGPMLAQGYRDGDDRAFDGHWLRTNDRGSWMNGRVSIDGRLDDIVSLHGVNVDLAAVQERVDQHPGIEASLIVVTVGESSDAETTDGPRIAMVYVGDPLDHEELRAWISPTLGAIACPTVLRQVDTLTRTLTGKVDRHATAASAGLRIGTPGKEGAA
ncbi:MAG: AMP-dependent synthetase, partial [Actinobacteria bacterium]|nr:AMP-dependent synthetase [Actinomycetota bacterium]